MDVIINKTHKIAAILVAAMLTSGFLAYYTFGRSTDVGFVLVGFDPDEAYVDMQFLTDIGPRVPGTKNDLRGAEYVRDRFTEAGLGNVHIEEYPMTTFEVNRASLSLLTVGLRGVVSKDYVHIEDFVLYQYSGSSNGEITVDIVDVGDGSEEALGGIDVTGKAVLTTQQALPRAAEHGAVAVIVQNIRSGEHIGFPPYSGGLYGSDENGDTIPYPDANPGAVIPTCSVSKAVGDEIKDAINNAITIPIIGTTTARVRLDFDTTIAKNKIYNVIGDVQGKKNGDIVYVIAHRDTTYINPGAVDNTVGTVTIMEMARQLAGYKVKNTIRFISADAEEKGLLGAMEYVKAHEEEVKEKGMICMNFDMNDVNLDRVNTLGVSISREDYVERLGEIRDMMFAKYPELAERYNIDITLGGGGPDAAPFMSRGINGSFAMGEWGSSWEYHTQWDTIEYVNKESWQLSGIIFGSLALEIGRSG